MLPFWIDLGSLPGLELIPFLVSGVAMFFMPLSGLGVRSWIGLPKHLHQDSWHPQCHDIVASHCSQGPSFRSISGKTDDPDDHCAAHQYAVLRISSIL